MIELEDAVPPSELHLDQALEEQERLERWVLGFLVLGFGLLDFGDLDLRFLDCGGFGDLGFGFCWTDSSDRKVWQLLNKALVIVSLSPPTSYPPPLTLTFESTLRLSSTSSER